MGSTLILLNIQNIYNKCQMLLYLYGYNVPEKVKNSKKLILRPLNILQMRVYSPLKVRPQNILQMKVLDLDLGCLLKVLDLDLGCQMKVLDLHLGCLEFQNILQIKIYSPLKVRLQNILLRVNNLIKNKLWLKTYLFL